MMEDNKPRESDLVLGGDNAPLNSFVLGGIDGVISRLESKNIQDKINALQEAIKYDRIDFNIIMEHLVDRHCNYLITEACVELLQQDDRPEAKKALQNHAPWLFFQTLDKWQIQHFAVKPKIYPSANNLCYCFQFNVNDKYQKNKDEWRYFEKFAGIQCA